MAKLRIRAPDRADAGIPFLMSAVGGIADVVCQGLSGPFIAITGERQDKLAKERR